MLVPWELGCGEILRIHTNVVEQQRHHCTADKHTEHRLPRGDTRPQQQDSTKCDGDNARLTDTSRNKTCNHIAQRGIYSMSGTHLSERRSSRDTISNLVGTKAQNLFGRYPYRITCHLRRIREEKEHTCSHSHIEDVHTCSTKDFLRENHGEGASQSQHPQWTVDGYNHRNDNTADQIAFLYLLTFPLCPGKLYAKSHDVAHENLRQHSQETVCKQVEERCRSQRTCQLICLITNVIHTKQ